MVSRIELDLVCHYSRLTFGTVTQKEQLRGMDINRSAVSRLSDVHHRNISKSPNNLSCVVRCLEINDLGLRDIPGRQSGSCTPQSRLRGRCLLSVAAFFGAEASGGYDVALVFVFGYWRLSWVETTSLVATACRRNWSQVSGSCQATGTSETRKLNDEPSVYNSDRE